MNEESITSAIINDVVFNENENNFYVNGVLIKFLFSADKKEFSEKGYSFSFFRKSGLAENNIFPIVTRKLKDDKTIGWMIPIAALESDKHDYNDNKHFAIFAYQAVEFLLKIFETNKITMRGTFDPLNCIRDDIAICVISNGLSSSTNGFEFGKYIPFFRTYGYAFIKEFSREEDYCDNIEFYQVLCNLEKDYSFIGNINEINKNIKICPLIDKYAENSFCLSFFKNMEFDNHAPLLVFLLLYQFIELHIELCARDKIHEFLEKTKKENWNSLMQFKMDITRISAENTFVKDFFQGQSGEELRVFCNKFLCPYYSEEQNDVGEAVYKVRNLIFHSNRNLKNEEVWLPNLRNINNELHDIIIKIMIGKQ